MNTQNVQSLIDQAKTYLPEDGARFGWLSAVFIYAGIGFISGFLLKFVGRFVFWFLLIGLIAVLSFQYLGLISINFENFHEFIGLDTNLTISQVFELSWKWVQMHIIESIACLVGFIFAFEVF